MDTPASHKRGWSRSDKVLLWVVGITVVLAALIALWTTQINAVPAVTVPAPTLPSSNAFDFFTAAGNAMVNDRDVGNAISRVPPSGPGAHIYTPAEKEALVRENAPALKTLRQGFTYPYRNPPVRSFNALMPYYARFRGLARLLSLESQVKAEHGDWGGAVSSDLDAMQLGTAVPHGSVFIGELVGVACQAIGRRPVWDNYSHLSVAQSRQAAQRIERLKAQQVPFADTLQEEKWCGQAGLLEIFRSADARRTLTQAGSDGESGNGSNLALSVALLLTPKRVIFNNYTRYMDECIANARLPYGTKPPTPPVPDDPINRILLPIFAQADLKDADNQAQNALLTTTLALHAYRLEHRGYPASLAQLVPAYLPQVPADPFAHSGPLRYKRRGTTYLVYSVGPDGVDDGGRPIFDRSKPAPESVRGNDQRYYVRPDSKGDVVAGVNVY